MNNSPINIHNIYKYLISLFKIKVIPSFEVEIKYDEISFIFTHATIRYNIYTKIWKSIINNNNYEVLVKTYPYLVKNIISINNEIILKSNKIDDILEPTFSQFNLVLIDNNNIDPRNMHTIDNKKIDNINNYSFYMFINNINRYELNTKFENYKKNVKYLPEELWCIINSYNKYDDMYYYNFLDMYLY
jgi:hypothetical protein